MGSQSCVRPNSTIADGGRPDRRPRHAAMAAPQSGSRSPQSTPQLHLAGWRQSDPGRPAPDHAGRGTCTRLSIREGSSVPERGPLPGPGWGERESDQWLVNHARYPRRVAPISSAGPMGPIPLAGVVSTMLRACALETPTTTGAYSTYSSTPSSSRIHSSSSLAASRPGRRCTGRPVSADPHHGIRLSSPKRRRAQPPGHTGANTRSAQTGGVGRLVADT